MADERDTWAAPEGGFDEDFVRGGRFEPPARTRASIARHEGRTHFRGPTDSELGGRARPSRPLSRARAGLLLSLVLGVGTAVILFADSGSRHGPAGQPDALKLSAYAGPADTDGVDGPGIDGISPDDQPGTCYIDDAKDSTEFDVARIDCALPHDFELAGYLLAAGKDDTYPQDAYWDDVVDAQCGTDLAAYAHLDQLAWPDSLTALTFVPRRDGWAIGDRTVYCLAHSVPAATGSVGAS